MEEFNGIISLLVACIELGLFVNLLIFVEKNNINKLIVLLTGLFFIYQLLEFTFCFAGVNSSFLIYIALISLIFQPFLAFFVVARINNISTKLLWLIFLPVVFFMLNYIFALHEINLAGCTFFNAQFNYPLEYFYMTFYNLPLFITMGLLIVHVLNQSDKKIRQLDIILLVGYGLASFIGMIIILFVNGAINSYEGILSKLSLIPSFAFALAALKNRSNNNNEKE